MSKLAKFLLFFLRSLPNTIGMSLFVAAVFYLPGYIIGFIANRLFFSSRYPLGSLLGGITLAISYLWVSRDFLRMYRKEKSFDKKSLEQLPDKMFYLFVGLALATSSILYGLLPWATQLVLFSGSIRPTFGQIGVFVLENLCRSVFLDAFEIFHVEFSPITHNPRNIIFCLYLLVFRTAAAGLVAAHIYLRYKQFKDPEGFLKEFSITAEATQSS
jgi:hypothetical protein